MGTKDSLLYLNPKARLGIIIKNYAKSNSMKLTYVAEKMAIPMETLHTILYGRKPICAEDYFKICRAMGIDPSLFINTLERANKLFVLSPEALPEALDLYSYLKDTEYRKLEAERNSIRKPQ
jgi:plasmid maintenance system antidote protein VapI